MLLGAGVARHRGRLPKGVAAVFESADASVLLASCGLEEGPVREAAQELAESESPLVLAGASVPHTNSLEAVVASHYVNLMLGNVGKPGGMLEGCSPPAEDGRAAEALAHAQMVLIDGANPVYLLPRASGVLDAMARAETVVGFGGFLDDTGAWADMLLPDHHALELEAALVPAVCAQPSLTVSMPFIQPLYETRAVERTLADLARAMQIDYRPPTVKEMVEALSGNVTDGEVVQQGGLWLEPKTTVAPRVLGETLELHAAVFAGDAGLFPLHFQPYISLQYHDGSGSNLPWLQELPDPVSSSIWGLPVEIDPKTAQRLRIANGDAVRVESPHGFLEAPAYVHPGAVPGVVSMAIGDGHTHYGRYASGRGANPLSILAPVWQKSTGVLALGATRVRLARIGGPRGWIQFAGVDRQERGFDHR
jgi:anaerobic selenocysteine-containing dehydrogenase